VTPELQVILSGALTFGVPLAVAVRDLVVTKRGGGWRPERLPEPEPRRPLPPCLLPPYPSNGRRADAPRPVTRPRVLEDA